MCEMYYIRLGLLENYFFLQRSCSTLTFMNVCFEFLHKRILKQKTEKITGCQLLELGIVARKDSCQRSEQIAFIQIFISYKSPCQAAWLVQKEPTRKELYHSNVLIIKMMSINLRHINGKFKMYQVADLSLGQHDFLTKMFCYHTIQLGKINCFQRLQHCATE